MSHWIGNIPEKCDICERPIKKEFIDGATMQGPWAIMCSMCHRMYGLGIGTGKGQLFQKQKDSSFKKVDG